MHLTLHPSCFKGNALSVINSTSLLCVSSSTPQLPTSSSSLWWSGSPLPCSWASSSSARWPVASWGAWRGSVLENKRPPPRPVWNLIGHREARRDDAYDDEMANFKTKRSGKRTLSPCYVDCLCSDLPVSQSMPKESVLYSCIFIAKPSPKKWFILVICCIAR